MALVSACGIPPSLMTSNSDGSAQREILRRFSAFQFGRRRKKLLGELSEKLERDITLHLDEMRSDDRVGMARVVKNLVDVRDSASEDASKAAMLVQAAG